MATPKRRKSAPPPLSADNQHVGTDPQKRDTGAVVISAVLIAFVAVIIIIALYLFA